MAEGDAFAYNDGSAGHVMLYGGGPGARIVFNLFKGCSRGVECNQNSGPEIINNTIANNHSNAWTGGVDFLKDDENLTSQVFNTFFDRVKFMTDEMK